MFTSSENVDFTQVFTSSEKRSQLHKMLAQLPKILQAQKMLTTSQAQKTFTTSKFSQAQKCGLQHYFRTLCNGIMEAVHETN